MMKFNEPQRDVMEVAAGEVPVKTPTTKELPKMKLELKHLAPYPKGINGIEVMADNDGIGRHIYGYYENGNVNLIPTVGEQEWWEVFRLKPILHPLSDLTRVIKHNGDTFVPIEKLKPNDTFEIQAEANFVNLNNGYTHISIVRGDGKLNDYCPFFITQKLFEWHFNVFSLPQELWADVNGFV